jgi:thiamine-monophosphate kinase
MLENNGRTELEKLGEFGLIDHIAASVKLHNTSSKVGIGDDAAVIGEGGSRTLVSTDMLVEGVHFDLSYVPLKHLGYKAVVVNLSDICAMNARPEQVTVSIAISNRFSLEAIEELYSGILLACEKYQVDLVGGDTTSSTSGLVISVTAIGTASADEVVLRSGARPTDLICVSGNLGGAYLGLQILEREKRIFKENPGIQPDLTGHDYILERQLKPEARTDIIDMLRQEGVIPTSMIDISDGLSSELLHICKRSAVGCRIYTERIPIDAATGLAAEELHLDVLTCALNGGEDYELLFTVDIRHHDRIKDNPAMHIIGHIVDGAEGSNLVSGDQLIPLRAQGWKHLS